MKTYSLKPAEVTRTWHLFDAKDQVLGRLTTQIAKVLMGKHKVTYTRHVDGGDHVVVINVDKVVLTGKKEEQKKHYRHSGYPGGFREDTIASVRAVHPDRILTHAVSGMLPDNKLKAKVLKHLHIYAGSAHPYEKQFGTVKSESVAATQ